MILSVQRWLGGPLLGLVIAGCAGRPTAIRSPASEPARSGGPWVSSIATDHPLVGRIWDPRARHFVDERALTAEIVRARYVLLGETHDNVDHHRLQASLVRALVAARRRPALAFEMFESDAQGAIDASVAAAPGDADALARAVRWEKSGWPDWAMYRPIAQAGLSAGLALVAANYPRAAARALALGGLGGVQAEEARRLGIDEPLAPALQASLSAELVASHCGKLPPEMLPGMAIAQRARDGQMASRMLAGDRGDGAVLIAGTGHARTDRGVPRLLARIAPGARVVSVAFIEVEPGSRAPDDYAAGYSAPSLPFDLVWFTPAAARSDPCARFERQRVERQRPDR